MVMKEIDRRKAEEFTGRVLTDTAATTTTILAIIGDRLGLFKDLAANGPATSVQLAARTGTDERYVREWLGAMFAAGYVAYDGEHFSLPPEHEPTLVQEPGPAFLGGVQQELMGCLRRFDQVVYAFRNGGGVALDEYPEEMWVGMERFTAQWHENMLVQDWIPRLPDVETKLRSGAHVADLGCGRGRAVIKLAQTFPDSTFVGYDVVESNIEQARKNAEEAGVAERVRFEALDAAEGLPERYDVITTFDMIHDAVDPLGTLKSIREALKPGGIYVCLDINCSDRLEDNVGPVASLLYGFSVMLCMTSSLAHGGEGLGTLGLHPKKLEELAKEAGFRTVRLVEMDNPFNNLYELRP